MRRLLLLILTAVLVVAGTTTAYAKPATVTAKTIRTAASSTVFAGGLYVQPDGVAASALPALRGAEKRAAKYIAKRPVAVWLGEWATGQTLVDYIERNLAAAEQRGTTAVFVTYALPDRDCGGHSAGGLDATSYAAWTKLVAKTLAGHRAVVLIEPDSLFILDSCPAGTADVRMPLLRSAVAAFSRRGIPSYLDGGVSAHADPAHVADRLRDAGIAKARGFFTNVANFRPLAEERAYAAQVSALTDGARYVIDVSRSGQGYKGDWCNPTGAGLGQDPRVVKGASKLDALLWVKTPGASDGACNGGPDAGAWFSSYAAELVRLRVR